MKVAFTTFGCQMNMNDTETMKGILVSNGHEIVEDESIADAVIVNTCAVRKKAEDKFFGKLGRLKHLKNTRAGGLNRFSFQGGMPRKTDLSPENGENPLQGRGWTACGGVGDPVAHRTTHDAQRTTGSNDLIIGICGCIAETRKEELLSNKAVNFVFGTRNISRINEFLQRASTGEHFADLSDKLDEIDCQTPRIRESSHHAWVTIIHGCDKFCSYCIVPYARGLEKSRPLDDILEEAMALSRKGYKEITYLGQNVDSYGKDFRDGTSLAKLLRETLKIDGLERIWFLTSYSKDFTGDLIDVIASDERIARSIHLPVQSGSNRILKAMNRGYTRDYFLSLVEKIRDKIPDTSISTDIIVGFPGETEKEYLETKDLLETVRFDRVNLAVYSPRRGTHAERTMEDDVPYKVKTERLNALLELQKHINRANNQKLIGKNVRIIVEGKIGSNGKLFGRTVNNKIVLFDGDPSLISNTIDVKLLKATAGPFYGNIEHHETGDA